MLQNLKSGFKRTINWNKYHSKVTTQASNPYLDYWIDPSFQRVNQLFALLFDNIKNRTVQRGYYLRKVEIKDYNVMIVGRNFFDQPVKNNFRTHDNIKKIGTGQWHDHTTGCLWDYNCLNEYYKMVAKHLRKQQARDVIQYNKLILP